MLPNTRTKALWYRIAAVGIAAILMGTARLSVAGPTPACGTDSLAGYVSASAIPGAVCSVGTLDFGAFSYHPVSNAPLASGIQISTAPSGAGLSITQTSGSAFTSLAGQTISFEIDFTVTVDTASPIFGAALAMPGFLGKASATEYLCSSSPYVYTGGCTGALPQTFAAGSAGVANSGTATLPFAGAFAGTQNIGLVITVGDISSGGTIDALTSEFLQVSPVPEPGSWAMMLAGLVSAGTIGGRCRRRRC